MATSHFVVRDPRAGVTGLQNLLSVIKTENNDSCKDKSERGADERGADGALAVHEGRLPSASAEGSAFTSRVVDCRPKCSLKRKAAEALQQQTSVTMGPLAPWGTAPAVVKPPTREAAAGGLTQCSNPACWNPEGRWLAMEHFAGTTTTGQVRIYKTCTHCRQKDAEKKRKKRQKHEEFRRDNEEKDRQIFRLNQELSSANQELAEVKGAIGEALTLISRLRCALAAQPASRSCCTSCPRCPLAAHPEAPCQEGMLELPGVSEARKG